MRATARYRVVRQLAALVAISLTLLIASCGSQTTSPQVNPPLSSSDLGSQNYLDIVEQFKAAGFTNVSTEAIRDLVTGWITSDGEIEEVSIAGSTDFESSDEFAPDVAVTVRYHTFPQDHTGSPAPETPESAAPPAQTETEPAIAETTAPAAPETLTTQNSSELAALLALKDPHDPSVAAFSASHRGQLIEFDGCVMDVAPHGTYQTRFDYLIAPGDYSLESISGPSFQFSDINYFDFGFPEDASPDSVPAGMNLHIIARVGAYDSTTGLFQLEPVSTSVR